MKKYNLILGLILLSCMSIYGQNSIFYEDFIDNSNNWYSLNSGQVIEMRYSKLQVFNTDKVESKVNKTILCPVEFNQNSDFTIESSMTLISGATGNGLIWNFKDTKNYCKFLITDRDREYAVYQIINGEAKALVLWSNSSSINKNFKKNILKIEKKGSNTNFYINGTKISSVSVNYTGSKIGVFLGGVKGAKLEVDYIEVSSQTELGNNTDKNAPKITIISPSISQEKQITIKGIVTDESGIFEVLINGQDTYIDERGHFSKTVLLAIGNNSFNVVATDIHKNTSNFNFTIERKQKQQNNIVTDNSPPQITITQPNISRGLKPVKQTKLITIQGKVTDASGIFEVLVNGEEAYIDAQGNFSKTVLLAIGDNSFIVTATDLKQNTSTKNFIIERTSNQEQQIVVNNNTNNTQLKTGKYYALIIGNNNYTDNSISSLDEPINDATKLYNVLTTQYTFEPQNVAFLKDATYVEMIEAFDNLSDKITPNDNLLVFYAGHGWWNETKKLGYWLPTDAKKNSTAFWIANSRISDYMGSINSKHTLLIADACFSGSIFKTRSAFADAQPSINKLYDLPSKKAMTSGNLKEVPDKSMFLYYLVKKLENNNEKYISADMLFASFRQAVMNNSQTEPQFGTIQNAGDEGGEFIFIRRQ